MRKKNLYNLLICILFFPGAGIYAQSTSTGTQQASAVINFSQLAQYYATHPTPAVQRLLPEPDDDGRPAVRPITNPAFVHRRASAPTGALMPSSYTPLLPVSPAPADSFESTLSNNTAIPPDTHGAADSAYLVTAINSVVHIQNRSGGNVSSVSLDQFWTSVLPSGTTGAFDPRIVYDPYTKRWIISALSDGENSNSSLLVGASETNDPTGNWYLFRVLIDATGTDWLDFDNLGFNNKWILLSGNLFSISGGTFEGARMYCFNKANVLANTNANHTIINETTSFSICPAFVYDSLEPNAWAIESWDGSQGELRAWKITGAVGSEVMTSVGYPTSGTLWAQTNNTVSGTSGADFAPQTGSTHKIQTNDDRMNNVVYRNGKLWCSHTVFLPYSTTANPTRASVQWWQIDTLATPDQIGLIDDATATNFYAFPSIAVNVNNDALIGFSHFSASIHPSAVYALHMGTDPADSMRPYNTFRVGQNTYYQVFTGTENRWGDYSATMFDPVNGIDFWTIQEASASTANYWDTWWAHVVMCDAPAAPTSITLPSAPPCPSATALYTTPAISGASSYTWSVSGTGWSGSSTTDSIHLTAGSVSATISVAAVASCGLSSAAYTITVTPSTIPATPSGATLPTAPCPGATATYKIPAVTGATSYTWSISGTGWSGTSTTDSIHLTAGSATASVSVTANNACGSSSAYVFSAPIGTVPAAPSSATLPTTPCSGHTATYTVPAVTGATTYTWTVSGTGWSGTSTTNSITLTAGTVTGSVSVTANNACGSSTAYVFSAPVNLPPAAPSNVTLPTAPCQGAVATYTVPAVTGATSYTWSESSGWSGSSTTNSINLTAGSSAGSISVTANNACGSSTAYVFTAPLGPVPAAPTSVNLPTAPCQGTVATYSVPVVTGATSYTWSVSGTGWSGSSTTNTINLTAGSTAATVSVTANNSCGSSTAYIFTAPLGPVPAAPSSVNLPTAPCQGTVATYSVPAVTGATSYTWSVSGTGWSGSSTSNTINLTAGSTAATVSVTANNSCGSSTAYVFTAPLGPVPAAPSGVTLPSTPCQGHTAVYTVPSVTGATSYTWSVSGSGWSGTSTTNSITLTAGSGAGSVSVTANNSCGSSTAYVFSVSSIPTITTAPQITPSSSSPCSGTSASYSVAPITGATSYVWQVSGTGWSGTSTIDNISLTAGTATGTIICKAQNSCGTGPADTIHVTPALLPAAASSISTAALLCSGNTEVFSTPAIANATSYIWTVSGTGWSGSSTTDSISLLEGTGTGSITVEGHNACGNGSPFTLPNVAVTTSPTAAFILTAHTTVIGHSVTATFSGSVSGSPVYTWTYGGGTAVPDTGEGPQVITWSTAGMKYITLTVNLNGCSSEYTDSVLVTKSTGIANVNIQAVDISVIPNPNDGSFTIQFSDAPTQGFSVTLTDVEGRSVYYGQFDAFSKTVSIDAQKLPSAVYIATISCGGASVTKKVVINK